MLGYVIINSLIKMFSAYCIFMTRIVQHYVFLGNTRSSIIRPNSSL